MKMIKKIFILILSIVISPALIYAAVSDFLILQDIGSYKFITESKNPLTKKIAQIPGYIMSNNSGVVAGSGHFGLDHVDATYETYYESDVVDLGVKVQVTKHLGADSDKWLMHEIEDGFKKRYSLGSAYAGKNPIRDFSGNRIFYMWREYRWISNNIVVIIEASDQKGLKPEPTEIVQAYMQKFPSTIPSALVLDDAHKVQWIKDEMDRRLWLCDKWFMQLQLRKVDEKQAYQESFESMNIFLDYREKYYGLKGADEKNLLAGYLNTNNGTGIKTKLDEYKKWWVVNKDKAISL
jgi:hypothetical protein